MRSPALNILLRAKPRPMLKSPNLVGYWNASVYDPTLDALPDLSGHGNHARLGSIAGADSNDPLLLKYLGELYTYMPGSSGNYASCPAIPAVDGATQLDVRVRFVPDDWTTLSKDFCGCYNSAANKRAFVFSSNPTTAKRLTLTISGNGTAGNAVNSGVDWPVTTNVPIWVRATWRASDQRTQFFTSSDYDLNTQTGTWTQVGPNVTMPGSVTSLFAATQPLVIGGKADQSSNWAGSYYQAELRLTIDGAVAATFDSRKLSEPFSGYTDGQGNVWTLNRSTSGRKLAVVDRSILLLGTDDFLEIADSPLINFDADASMTAAIVFRRFATPTNFGRFMSKYSAATNGFGYVIQNLNTSGALYPSAGDGTQKIGGSAELNRTISNGTLTAFGMQIDRAAKQMRSFINTGPQSLSLGTLGSISNSAPLRIGAESYTLSSYQDFEFVAAAIWRDVLSTKDWTKFLNEIGIPS